MQLSNGLHVFTEVEKEDAGLGFDDLRNAGNVVVQLDSGAVVAAAFGGTSPARMVDQDCRIARAAMR